MSWGMTLKLHPALQLPGGSHGSFGELERPFKQCSSGEMGLVSLVRATHLKMDNLNKAPALGY